MPTTKNILISTGLLLVAICIALMLDGCYKCDGPGYPSCPDIQPNYPPGSDIVVTYPDESVEALSSPAGKACANLRKLSCPEGTTSPTGITCYRALVHMLTVRRVPIACWIAADSIDHLRACGPEMRCVP